MGIDVRGVTALPPDCETTGWNDACYADASNKRLARLAQANDKKAQLQLGIRDEHGVGLTQDLNRAEQLYRQAATDIGGPTSIYEPSSIEGKPGRMSKIDTPVLHYGLIEAQRRLDALRGRKGELDES